MTRNNKYAGANFNQQHFSINGIGRWGIDTISHTTVPADPYATVWMILNLRLSRRGRTS